MIVTDPGEIADQVVEAWKRPKLAFLLGALFGIIIVGSLVISPPAALQSLPPEDVGETVVTHYQNLAPTGVDYELAAVQRHDSGLRQVTIDVTRGTLTTQEVVYVTRDGQWVFEQPPNRVQPSVP